MEVGDALRCALERVAQLDGDGVERGAQISDRHPQLVQSHAIETLGELSQREVAARLDVREDLTDGIDRLIVGD